MAYAYSIHKTRDAAELALESYFAEELVCKGERPFIKSERRVTRDQTALYRTVYCVMFPG